MSCTRGDEFAAGGTSCCDQSDLSQFRPLSQVVGFDCKLLRGLSDMPVQNAEIAAMFDRAAELLEIGGENRFRVRAYRRAAREIEGLPKAVASLLKSGRDLPELPGIGKIWPARSPTSSRQGVSICSTRRKERMCHVAKRSIKRARAIRQVNDASAEKNA